MILQQAAAIFVFVITFVVILSERLHRTTAAMLGATAMLGLGMLLGFYSQEQALRAIDFNTLGLLLGMMILVRLLQQTGFFRYIAILTGKRSRGQPWRLLVILGAATTALSMLLDNVTTVVLVAPVTILIAEIVGLSPMPFLVAEAVLSNVGGVATLVGDPPNVMIGSAAHLTFGSFLTHLGPVVAVSWLVALGVLRLAFHQELAQQPTGIDALLHLDENEALQDPEGMRKGLIILGIAVALFFVHGQLHLQPAVIAMGSAAAALFFLRPQVDEALRQVEWGVLLFFAALFVVTGGLEAADVLASLATKVAGLAQTNPLSASLLLLWVAAGVSAVVDNIPFTIALIPVVQRLGELGVPIASLWWALALGAGFGGNGTPIGATANVIIVALSAGTRTPITSKVWLRSGLPVMLATCLVASLMLDLLFRWMSVP